MQRNAGSSTRCERGVSSRQTVKTARSADGVPIPFDVQGQGEPTLVLVHGWAFDRHLWDEHAPRLARRHRVVTLDLAGHGESGKQRARWTMAAFGEDLT